MPRARLLLPQRRRVGAHVVGPRRGLVEALARAKDLLDMGARQSGELSLGDRGDDPVPGLAPSQSGGGNSAAVAASAARNWIRIGSGTPDSAMAGACPVTPVRDKSMTDEDLVRLAREAAGKAYAPYSNFHVGCAIESVDGAVVTGANMENACYRLGVCAEQSALTAAQHQFGLDKVARIAVSGGSGAVDVHAVRRVPAGDPRGCPAWRAGRRDLVQQRRWLGGRAPHHRRADPVRLRPREPKRLSRARRVR